MVKHKKMFKFENIQMYKMFNNFVKNQYLKMFIIFKKKKQRTKKENQLNQKRAKNHRKHKTKRSNKTIT
jgi:hypothetical protein